MSTPSKKPINLLRGWPSTSLLPSRPLLAASQAVLSDPQIFTPALLYGPDPGYQPLREELARWLGRFYNHHHHHHHHPSAAAAALHHQSGNHGTAAAAAKQEQEPEDVDAIIRREAEKITITGGASQSVACILQSFTDPVATRAVWMVAPCYFLACPIFADAGFGDRLQAVPEDDEGIDLVRLEEGMSRVDEEAAERERENGGSDGGGGGGDSSERKRRGGFKDPGPHRKIYRHVVYCVPSFSNPSGKTMSRRRREGLVWLARRYDALVICDDVYDFLQWPVVVPPSSSSSSSSASSTSPNQPPRLDKSLHPRLPDLESALYPSPSPHDPPGKTFGHAVSNGSFSKLVGPGVRTGWTYSTADFAYGLAQTGSTKSGGAPSQMTAAVLWSMLRSGDVDRHIRGTLRAAYQRRHGLLMHAVTKSLVKPFGARVVGGTSGDDDDGMGDEGIKEVFGGYFVWISFPARGDSSSSRLIPPMQAVAERCRREEELMIGAGGLFEVHGDEDAVRFERDLRLCFAWEDEADLVEGVERLGRVIGRMVEEGPNGWGGKGERGKAVTVILTR
ncbi:Aspartate/tyrosine/aromatic aminotransferase [Xylariomycetidae sp. FL2044]|nr:Aspartate/tyrosine/aromatic aminotransferase [Xylariomycetidae sp. FL2044]